MFESVKSIYIIRIANFIRSLEFIQNIPMVIISNNFLIVLYLFIIYIVVNNISFESLEDSVKNTICTIMYNSVYSKQSEFSDKHSHMHWIYSLQESEDYLILDITLSYMIRRSMFKVY